MPRKRLQRKGKPKASKQTKKWKIVEGVVAAIEASLATVPGTSVVPNASVRVRGEETTRQVDIVVKIPTGDREMRIGVEVKDERQPLDVVTIEQLGAKLAKLDLDRGCVVAAAFTAEARREATRCGLELREIREATQPHWFLPQVMPLIHQEIEPFECILVFAPEANTDGLISELDKLYFCVPGCEPLLIRDVVMSEGVRAASDREELASLQDGDVFGLNIEISLPEGSFTQAPNGTYPLTKVIRANYRIHQKTEDVAVRPYGIKDSIALSSVSELSRKQFTFVGIDQPDGTRRFSVSVTDASPKRVEIEPSS